MPYQVYILRCADRSYYVGHTENLPVRIELHNVGRAATWTALRRPVTLLYHEMHPDEASAVRREIQIKRWSRAKKEALVAGDVGRLRQLSRRGQSRGKSVGKAVGEPPAAAPR